MPHTKQSKPTRAPKTPWIGQAPVGVIKKKDGQIACGDALDFLKTVRDRCADIVFLDPPFNLGKVYGSAGRRADLLAEADYARYMAEVLGEVVRILKPGASVYLYHIPRWALALSRELEQDLQFRHWIAISMKNGFVRGKGLYPAHYALLHYSKGRPTVANRPKVDPPICPHCGEFVKDYGGYKEHVADGVNLSDVWEDLSPVRHRKFKTRDANELPIAIPLRAIDISGPQGGLLVDPFAGSGTSLVAARLRRMRFLGNDRESENCEVMSERLDKVTGMRPRSKREGAE